MNNFKTKRLEIFKKVFPFIKEQKFLYFLLSALKVWDLILSLLGPLLYLILINDIMVSRNLLLLPFIILGYIAIYILQTLNIVLNKTIYNNIFLKFNLKIKKKMLFNFFKIDTKSYINYDTGDLKNRIDNDVEIMEKFFNTHILNYFYAVANIIIIAIILLYMSWILALVSFVAIPISFWFVKFMGKRALRVNEQQRKLQGEYEGFLYETFKNWKQVKVNNLEQNRSEEFSSYREKLAQLFVQSQIYWYINRAFISFKEFFITRMNLYFFGGLLIMNGNMDVGLLLAFMGYYKIFFESVSNVTDSILELKKDIPNIDRIFEILNIKIPNKPKIKSLRSDIFVRNLDFRYHDKQPLVLSNINLSIDPKEHIAIVGRSGCGKTTLGNLLLGLYEPFSGEIYFGDVNINKISPESVRNKIGIVFQESRFLNLSIRENLQLVKRNIDISQIIVACKKANVYDFISNLPHQFETLVGENGVKLSGGEKQRLSIVRILLQSPDIVIFDESTSALDSENEKLIVEVTRELLKEKTVITIAHRLSTILECNRVVIIDNGKILEVGTHEELKNQNKIYDLLFKKQYQTQE